MLAPRHPSPCPLRLCGAWCEEGDLFKAWADNQKSRVFDDDFYWSSGFTPPDVSGGARGLVHPCFRELVRVAVPSVGAGRCCKGCRSSRSFLVRPWAGGVRPTT